MSRPELQHAAELLDRLLPAATPAPWRDGSVDGNRYGALTSPVCTRDCDAHAARHAHAGLPWGHPHDGYGGCLVAESIHPEDRRLLAVLRNVADDLPHLLRAVAEERPAEVGHFARSMATAVLAAHRPLDAR